MAKNYIFVCVICFLLGTVCSGVITHGRSAAEIDRLNQQYDQLTGEYSERQRVIESNIGQCLGYVETAREITERTGANASAALGNLREASDLIRQGIAERESLKVELDRLSATLYGLRDMGRVQD